MRLEIRDEKSPQINDDLLEGRQSVKSRLFDDSEGSNGDDGVWIDCC